MTKREAAMVLKVLQGAYRTELRDDTIDAYTAMLSDLDFELVRQAVNNLIRTQKFMPAISEIREEAMRLANPLPSVDQAYFEARMAARNYSPYDGCGGGGFSHPLIKQAVDIVGLQTLAYSDQPTVVAAQFRQVYTRLLESEISRRKQAPNLNPPGQVQPLMFEARKALMQRWTVNDEEGKAC